MSEKVTVSREVAKAIEYRRSIEGGGYNFKKFMQVKTARFDFGEPVEVLNDVPIETLASALINGYEVKNTPEENLREYYDNFEKYPLEHADSQVRHGIRAALNILGIKIEGVNGK